MMHEVHFGLQNVPNDTTFVRMRNGGHLGAAKLLKNGTSLGRI